MLVCESPFVKGMTARRICFAVLTRVLMGRMRRQRPGHGCQRAGTGIAVCAHVPSRDHQRREPARLEPPHVVPRTPPGPRAGSGTPPLGAPPLPV